MNEYHTREENLAQAEALRRMQGDVLESIERYGADFRDIITSFQLQHGRVPSADDLLWIESERNGRDITQG